MATRAENRLAKEASPYLQQHSHNPVDWFPWGTEAFARAKAEDKPILLSIGYSACHWCHVMERESFEDDAISALMNDNFVSVKVDREERPDLDQIYQLVVQLMGKSGGWPLTVFLTPDQKPFFGGTYFPPQDRYGMPGFPKILTAIADAYKERRDEVTAQAGELTDAIRTATAIDGKQAGAAVLGPDLLARTSAKLGQRFDDQHGGFGARPKFPNTMPLDVLLRRGALEKDPPSLARVGIALDAMRRGGIYDQIGFGFHRYSTDERWLVPHFEKMLYDNALLMRLYVDGFRAMGEERYATTAREIATYVQREMTDGLGGFYATQDADSEGEEGKFFVWTPDEIARIAGDDAKVAHAIWGVTPEGNFNDGTSPALSERGPHQESGATVLHVAKDVARVAIELGMAPSAVEASLARASAAMFAEREKRPRPFRDEKILASWNGLMIGAFADAGSALGIPDLVAAAERAFVFVEGNLVVEKAGEARVLRHVKDGVVKGPGFLDDHSFLADAALDLWEATGNPRYVARARALADTMLARFWDDTDASFYFTADDGEALIHRAKDPFDHAIPSGSSIACKVLLRLGVLLNARYTECATRALEQLAPVAIDNPFGLGQTVGLLDRLVRGSVDVVLVGARRDTAALAQVAFAAYLPNRTIAWVDPNEPATLAACAALADGKAPRPEPVAYVCRGRTCSPPVSTATELRELLARRD